MAKNGCQPRGDMEGIGLGMAILSLFIWIGLLLFRGQFWRTDQQLSMGQSPLDYWPAVCVVIPARNEVDLIGLTIKSLLTQDYLGNFILILVDDDSTDGTAEVAQEMASSLGKGNQLQIIPSQPLPNGWTGKLWALDQGTRYAQSLALNPLYILLSDADIEHDRRNLSQLIMKAERESLDLASLMVYLRCQSFWEKLLIPAFIFFFAKLYPFRQVNNPKNSTAAAAGGCILIRTQALIRIGGIASIRHALIDDCTLAQRVKAGNPFHPIWLGLSKTTHSLRPYDTLSAIWNMVARSAYTQLDYSPIRLLGTFIGMTIVYLIPPMGLGFGLVTGQWILVTVSLSTWVLMSLMYQLTIHFYRINPMWSITLPITAFLYTLMTLDSAWRHWQGRGGAWKGRVYSGESP